MKFDRFAFDSNCLLRTCHYQGHHIFWPPVDGYSAFCLDLSSKAPSFVSSMSAELDLLEALIDAEWHYCNMYNSSEGSCLKDASLVAQSLRRIASLLPNANDQRALRIRANSVEKGGYEEDSLRELAEIDEEVSFVAGKISTWYGKRKGGLPTAFGCVRDTKGSFIVSNALGYFDNILEYISSLHKHLRLADLPVFKPTNIFFMVGEGNRHPKHIAYFLPEDEGLKFASHSKTYYFVNTHRTLLDNISLPLVAQLLDIGRKIESNSSELDLLPTLGVLSHEIGHSIYRECLSFKAVESSDVLASLVLQETTADVFGLLILAEVFAPAFHLSPADAVLYHLSECLRYVDRGLGCFADSDGMYLQLNYLVKLGALVVDPEADRLLVGDPEIIIAAFRSLARVLADTFLASDVRRSISLCKTFGPANAGLVPLIRKLRNAPPKTVEYITKVPWGQSSRGPERHAGDTAREPCSV